jgi:hypothetical protein
VQFSGTDVLVMLQVLTETPAAGGPAYAAGARIRIQQ